MVDKPSGKPDVSVVMYRFMLYFLASLAVFLALAWPAHRKNVESRERILVERLQGFSDVNERLIQQRYRELYSDIRMQVLVPSIRQYMTTGNTVDRAEVEAFLLKAAKTYQHYNQIRILDLEGKELIRVNHRDGRTESVPAAELQNKIERYYFKEALRLSLGEVYAAPLDLNVEYGRLEYPIRPTQRLAIKVTDNAGVPRGILVMNHDPSEFLAEFKTSMGLYKPVRGMLLNFGGYWVSDVEPDNEWGWMLGHPERSLAVQQPDIWHTMRTQPRGEIRTHDGLYLFRQFDPFHAAMEYDKTQLKDGTHSSQFHWHGIMAVYMPEISWRRYTVLAQPGGQIGLALIVLLLAVLSWILAQLQVQKAVAHAERTRHMREMERQAHTDVLTGAFNRRHFYLFGERELSRARRIEDPLSLLMLDIDHFKRINDEYGHDAGDEALKLLTRTCLQQLRPHDLFARTGGEEFAALLPHTDIADAAMVAERIRRSVEDLVLPLSDGREVRFTVSIGVVQWHAGDADLEALFKRADQKLYQAKDEGRDRVCT